MEVCIFGLHLIVIPIHNNATLPVSTSIMLRVSVFDQHWLIIELIPDIIWYHQTIYNKACKNNISFVCVRVFPPGYIRPAAGHNDLSLSLSLTHSSTKFHLDRANGVGRRRRHWQRRRLFVVQVFQQIRDGSLLDLFSTCQWHGQDSLLMTDITPAHIRKEKQKHADRSYRACVCVSLSPLTSVLYIHFVPYPSKLPLTDYGCSTFLYTARVCVCVCEREREANSGKPVCLSVCQSARELRVVPLPVAGAARASWHVALT